MGGEREERQSPDWRVRRRSENGALKGAATRAEEHSQEWLCHKGRKSQPGGWRSQEVGKGDDTPIRVFIPLKPRDGEEVALPGQTRTGGAPRRSTRNVIL
jgi:hypothetical protein